MGRFRLDMNERLVIGSRCCLNLTPAFASGDSVVARVLRGTKVSYGRSPNAPQPLPQRQPRIVPLDLVKEIGAGASGLRRKSLLDQLCNDLFEDRMHVEVGGKYIPVPDLQNLGAMGESTATSDQGRIVSV